MTTESLNLPPDVEGMRRLAQSTGGALIGDEPVFQDRAAAVVGEAPPRRVEPVWNSGWLLGLMLGLYGIGVDRAPVVSAFMKMDRSFLLARSGWDSPSGAAGSGGRRRGATPRADKTVDELRGERVGWARLKTPSEYWRRHATGDPVLMRFIRENTSLNIDPTWYVADIDKLNELCAYPLVFSQGLGMVEDARSRANLAEYVRRGGFLLIDCCINNAITPNADVFLRDQLLVLGGMTLPEARIVALPSTHDIYRCYFQIPGGTPPHTFSATTCTIPAFARHGLVRDQGSARGWPVSSA